MKLRLLITSVVVAAAMLLPSAATATSDDDRGRFLSLPPDLTTAYLQGHFPHRDPRHPHAKYRHRKLATATTAVWTGRSGQIVHAVANPDLRTRFSADGRSFWTIDEGWDFFWPNPDGTEFIEGTATHFWVHDKTSVWDGEIADIDPRICQFLTPRPS